MNSLLQACWQQTETAKRRGFRIRIFHGSLANLPEGLKVLCENLVYEDSDYDGEEPEESKSSDGASF